MAEYIDRDMFLKIISHKPSSPTTDREDRLINSFISAVKNCPAADVRPVVRGRWIMTTERFAPERICSSCKCRFPVSAGEGITEVLNYCPNCGARMEES